MKLDKKFLFIILAALSVLVIACSFSNIEISKKDDAQSTNTAAAPTFPSPTLVPSTVQDPSQGMILVTGDFAYTNDFYPEGYAYEYSVSMIDMTGFVLRDEEWEMPVEAQVLGFVQVNTDENNGTYRMSLPARPSGSMNDVDQDGEANTGVQVFAIEFSPNWTDGPFYEGDDLYMGWASYLATVKVDTEDNNEVTGGKLIVWAPDDEQKFPNGFGPDGLLFTADDPVVSLAAGYSMVDLDQTPFSFSNRAEEQAELYEPQDVAVKDFSALSYVEAFDSMFEIVSKEYAFNGIDDKQPDWDSLYADLSPRVKTAQEQRDDYGFYLALRDFVMAFEDGHVSLDGAEPGQTYLAENILGGFGLSARELDDGRVIVVYILDDGPADKSGIQVGAEIIAYNNQPIAIAISEAVPFSPQSTDFGLRYEQVLFRFRSGIDDEIEVKYKNPGQPEKSAKLKAVYELDSLYATYLGGSAEEITLPIEYAILESGAGYVQINSNSDDLNLSYRLFKRALEVFEENCITSLLIDMRLNFGGSPLGLAGHLTDQEIMLGQLSYFSEKTGQFEPDGPPDRVIPSINQFRFDNIVLLVDQFCYSACEIEAYAFSQVPGVEVLGQFPTAGVEAETARGDFLLPDGMAITVPTGRFTLPDGSIMLEGQGVELDVRIPVSEELLLAPGDPVLDYAEDYLMEN